MRSQGTRGTSTHIRLAPFSSIRYDHNQNPDVFKVTEINYNEKTATKNDERVGFPDISDSQAVLLRGI